MIKNEYLVLGWKVHSIISGEPVKIATLIEIVEGLKELIPTLPTYAAGSYVGKGDWMEDEARPLFFVYIGAPDELVVSDDKERIYKAWEHATSKTELDTSKGLHRELRR